MRIASMFISVILLLSLMGIVLGCSSDKDETETSVNQSEAEMIKIMNYVPENVDSFIFGDIAAMRTEENRREPGSFAGNYDHVLLGCTESYGYRS
ncbi:hypothetical protein ACFLU3_00695 [Chloroflexota bacterium]